MPMNLGTVCAVLALATVLVLSPAGGESFARELNIDEAVELALERNLSLDAARLDYESANWGLRSARASLLPSVGLSSTARRVDQDTYTRANASLGFAEQMGIDVEPFLYETTYETGFRVSAPIWNGQLWGAVGVAGGARDAAGHAYEARRRAVVAEAKAAYFGVLRAEALLSVSLDAVDAAWENAEAARRRHEVGLVPLSEVLRWQVLAAEYEKALADAETAVTMARTQLVNVLGLPLDLTFEFPAVDPAALDARYTEFAWLTAPGYLTESRARELLAGNPDYEGLADVTRMSGAGVSVARGAFMPSLNASGSYGWKADSDIKPDDETAWSVTLALDLPIFTSFKNVSDYQQSKRSYLAARRRQEDLERVMIASLRGAVSILVSSSKALVAADKLIEQSADHLKSVTNRHNEGMAPYTEFTDARVLFDRSRVGYVNAIYDGLMAVAEIERLLGDAPDGDAPDEDAAGGDAPDGDAPDGDAPAEDAPAEDAPAEDAPAEETGE
jgi:outer membrane protein TolC